MRLDRHLATLTIATFASACAHGLQPTPQTTKLIAEQSEGAVRPIIHTRVGGHPMTFVIDTGAVQSVLPAGFVFKYKIPFKSTTADPRMVDVHGSIVSFARAPGTPVQFDGETAIHKIDFIVNPVDGSDSIGYLAPQDLVRSGWAVVLDFEHGEFRYEEEAIALKQAASGSAPLKELQYKSCGFDAHRITPVTINGISSSLIVDTGASRTALTRNNEAIPSMASKKGKRSTNTGFTSLGQELVVSGVPLSFADQSFDVTASILPSTEACGRGLLGADVLSQCIVVWGSSSLWAACKPQPDGR